MGRSDQGGGGEAGGDVTARIIAGDCRILMPPCGPFDLIIADPPYGDTSLDWDRKVKGWESVARGALKPTGSIRAYPLVARNGRIN